MNKSYKLDIGTSRSKLAAAFAAQCSKGKAGERLIVGGPTQENFCHFLADLATRAIAAKYDQAKLAATFQQVAAGNASQARQAIGELLITFEGEKQQSVSAYWAKTSPSGPAVGDMLADL